MFYYKFHSHYKSIHKCNFTSVAGKSKRASVLVLAVEKATENFIERGEQIANENPDIKQEMLTAVDEVRKTGEIMRTAAREFSEDPCSSLRRGNMVRAARNLLSAVTRLLVLADMVDVHLLLKSLHVVQDDLNKLRNASSQDELLNNMRVSNWIVFAESTAIVHIPDSTDFSTTTTSAFYFVPFSNSAEMPTNWLNKPPSDNKN